MWFEAHSGLRINLEKSKVIPMGKVENIDELAQALDCWVGGLPSSYLGLPLGTPFKSVSVWDGVEVSLHKRWALWTRQCISKRETLHPDSETISILPIYFMSLFHIPRLVRLRMEKI